MKCTVCGGSRIEEFEHGLISRQCEHCGGTGVEPDNQPIGSADPSESTVTKKSKTRKRTRKKSR